MPTLIEAVQTNDRRTTLLALRDHLAQTLQDCNSGRDTAALSKRIMEVMQELDGLPDPDEKPNALAAARRKAANRGR